MNFCFHSDLLFNKILINGDGVKEMEELEEGKYISGQAYLVENIINYESNQNLYDISNRRERRFLLNFIMWIDSFYMVLPCV